jgi:hypothetical protein
MGIFNWLFSRNASPSSSTQHLREAVGRIVELSPPLRFANHYEERLSAAVRHSLEHIEKLVESLPVPLEARPSAWSVDPQLHAFFATAADVTHTISGSADLQAYFDQHLAASEAIGVLSMAVTERNGIGVKEEGAMVRRDVARTTVSFDDHLVRLCCATVEGVREALIRIAVDQLAIEGLARIEADTSRRQELEQEHALLKARLQLMERRQVGMHALTHDGAVAAFSERAQVQAQIEDNEYCLAKLGQKSDALERKLSLVCEVLAQPATYVEVTTKPLRLNQMNVLIEADSAEPGTELELRLARIPGNPPRSRALALVRVFRADVLPRGSLLDEAKRLVI